MFYESGKYILNFDLCAAALALLLIFVQHFYVRHKRRTTYVLMHLELLVFLYSLLKTLTFFMRADPAAYTVTAISVANLFAHLLHGYMLFILFCFFAVLCRAQKHVSIPIRWASVLPFACYALFLLMPPLQAHIYTISPEGFYMHQDMHGIIFGETVLYILMTMGLVFLYQRELGQKYKPAILMNLSFLLFYTIDSMLGIRVANFAMALNLVLFALLLDGEELEHWRYDSMTDALAGMTNRYGLRIELPEIVGQNLCVGIFDINKFKHFNDTYGHRNGDDVIRLCAGCLKGIDGLRCYRYGGDEFLIISLFPPEPFLKKLQYLQSDMAHSHLDNINEQITATIGYTYGYPQNVNEFWDLVSIADSCLYVGKEKKHLIVGNINGQIIFGD